MCDIKANIMFGIWSLVAFDLTLLAAAAMCIRDARLALQVDTRHHRSSISAPPSLPCLSAACIMSIPRIKLRGHQQLLPASRTLAASSLPLHSGDLRGTNCCLQLFY